MMDSFYFDEVFSAPSPCSEAVIREFFPDFGRGDQFPERCDFQDVKFDEYSELAELCIEDCSPAVHTEQPYPDEFPSLDDMEPSLFASVPCLQPVINDLVFDDYQHFLREQQCSPSPSEQCQTPLEDLADIDVYKRTRDVSVCITILWIFKIGYILVLRIHNLC